MIQNLSSIHILFFFFFLLLGAQRVFGLFIPIPKQFFLPRVFWALISNYGQDMFMLLLIFIPLMVLLLFIFWLSCLMFLICM